MAQLIRLYFKNFEFGHLLKTVKGVILLVSKGYDEGTGKNQGTDSIQDEV